MTVVWGVTYLAEAGVRVIIIETLPTTAALAVSKLTPAVAVAILGLWTTAYGRWAQRQGERAVGVD